MNKTKKEQIFRPLKSIDFRLHVIGAAAAAP
jgi:hypothetical protein